MTFQTIGAGMNEQPLKVSAYRQSISSFPNSEETLDGRRESMTLCLTPLYTRGLKENCHKCEMHWEFNEKLSLIFFFL